MCALLCQNLVRDLTPPVLGAMFKIGELNDPTFHSLAYAKVRGACSTCCVVVYLLYLCLLVLLFMFATYVCYEQLISMAANKSEREFAKIVGLPEEMLLESFKENLEKKEKALNTHSCA